MPRETLQDERKQKGLSQAKVAEYVGISARMYRYIENGEKNGSIEVWKKLSKLFGKSIEYLEENKGKEVEK